MVGATGTAVAGVTGAIHGGLLTTTPTATTPAQTVFIAPPFPADTTSFNLDKKNDAVMTVEKALLKAGLLPATYVTGTMNTQTQAALVKYEAKQGIKVTGTLPQIIYDELKGSL